MHNVELTVSEAASHLKVSPDTIRRWDKKGVLRSKRSSSNYRIFDLKDLESYHKKLIGGSNKPFKVLRAKKRSSYSSIELFSGCGGTALGFDNAGINHVLLNDFDFDSVNTTKSNKKSWNVTLAPVELLSFDKMEADILQGGFPCQAFSYAGNKRGFEDTRGTLFFQFARCIKELRKKPKLVVAENVRGLLNHDSGKTLNTMLKVLNELGYKTYVKLFKSQFFNVPQKRERLFIFGIHKSLKNLDLLIPKETEVMTLGEALKNCPVSEGMNYSPSKYKVLDMVPEGGNWRDLPEDIQRSYMKKSYFLGGGKTGMARRLSLSEPSLTLTCNPAQNQTERCHPIETRPLNIREYARIQTFPDSWKFAGSVSSQYKQIGNAVPVNLAYHIGRCLIAMLDGTYDDLTMEKVK